VGSSFATATSFTPRS